ncbi:hypothetical protein C8J57DRAFT_1482271 [Mycena rebaudengoi]|nr:hypothetical protein C8J57DRAFT_1482271 [Mycena rebaudengoi]
MSSNAHAAPSKATHGGLRVGSGRKSKAWHEERRREETEQRAQEMRATAGQQSQPQIQAPSHPIQSVPSTAPFFDQRNNTRGIALQDTVRGNFHPNHGLQVHSDPVTMSSNIETSPPGDYTITQDSFDRLVEELRFLDLNDPNGDITSGENPIEDSLFDGTADDQPDAATDAAAAADETRNLEPAETSVHRRYLQNLRTKTTSEIATHGQPDCYRRGQLFHYAKHALFAVQDAIVDPSGFKPDSLYHLDVLIWVPHLLAKSTSLKCECGMGLISNGFNSDPIARRVHRRPTDYFLLTNRYLCNNKRINNPGCGQNYQGTDVHIFAQLPRLVQLAFPVYLSARSAIDKQMMGEVVSLFTSCVGPGPYSELFSETQHRVHAERELIWLAAADQYGFSKVTPFSSFNDPLRYGGFSLSVKYIRAMFVDWFAAHRIFFDRSMAAKSGKRLAGDHTFWIVNHTGKLKGEPIHSALYSVMNENEEVRATTMCLTKAMPFVQGLYEGIEKGLREHGHEPTQVVCCDQPQVERSFHEGIMPSLRDGVEHITIYSHLPALKFSGLSKEISLDSHSIQSSCSDILAELLDPSAYCLVAVAIKSNGCSGPTAKVDFIQLQTSKKVYILQVSEFRRRTDVVPCLHSVLTSRRVIKVGHEIKRTLLQISDALDLPELETLTQSSNPPILDIGKHARLKGISEDIHVSLHALTGILLQHSYTPPDSKPALAWSTSPPSPQCIAALALEVDCIWHLYQALALLEVVTLRVEQTQCNK